MIRMTPLAIHVIDRTGVDRANQEDRLAMEPEEHPDWEVIRNANPPERKIERPHNPMAGVVLALGVEILICLALWGLMHWRGIL